MELTNCGSRTWSGGSSTTTATLFAADGRGGLVVEGEQLRRNSPRSSHHKLTGKVIRHACTNIKTDMHIVRLERIVIHSLGI